MQKGKSENWVQESHGRLKEAKEKMRQKGADGSARYADQVFLGGIKATPTWRRRGRRRGRVRAREGHAGSRVEAVETRSERWRAKHERQDQVDAAAAQSVGQPRATTAQEASLRRDTK